MEKERWRAGIYAMTCQELHLRGCICLRSHEPSFYPLDLTQRPFTLKLRAPSPVSSLMAACPLLSILRVRFMNCTLWICRRPPRDGIVNAPRGSLTKKCGGETRRIGGKDFFFSLCVECARSWNLMANLCSLVRRCGDRGGEWISITVKIVNYKLYNFMILLMVVTIFGIIFLIVLDNYKFSELSNLW